MTPTRSSCQRLWTAAFVALAVGKKNPTNKLYATIGEVSGGLSPPHPQTLDHGQYFFQNGIRKWHLGLLYTAIHNISKFIYVYYPSGMLED